MFKKFSDLFQFGQPKHGVLELPRLSKSESDSLYEFLSKFFRGLQMNDKNDVVPTMKSSYCPKQGMSYYIPTKNGEVEIKLGKRKYTKSTC